MRYIRIPEGTMFSLRKLKTWRRWRRNESLEGTKLFEAWWWWDEWIGHTRGRWHHKWRVLLIELVWL
jgi:hypothetical protein